MTRPSTAGIVIFRRPAGPCSAAGARGCFGPPHVVWRCDRAARHGAGCVIGAHHGDFGAILGGRGTVYLSWSGHVVVTDGRGLGRDLTIPLGECRPVGDQLWCTIVAVRPPRGRFRAATAVSPAGLDAAGTLLAVDRDDATILAYGAGRSVLARVRRSGSRAFGTATVLGAGTPSLAAVGRGLTVMWPAAAGATTGLAEWTP